MWYVLFRVRHRRKQSLPGQVLNSVQPPFKRGAMLKGLGTTHIIFPPASSFRVNNKVPARVYESPEREERCRFQTSTSILTSDSGFVGGA